MIYNSFINLEQAKKQLALNDPGHDVRNTEVCVKPGVLTGMVVRNNNWKRSFS